MAEISVKSHFRGLQGQMHIFVNFHVSNYFDQKVTSKTRKKPKNTCFVQKSKKSKKLKKSVLAVFTAKNEKNNFQPSPLSFEVFTRAGDLKKIFLSQKGSKCARRNF